MISRVGIGESIFATDLDGLEKYKKLFLLQFGLYHRV